MTENIYVGVKINNNFKDFYNIDDILGEIPWTP